MPFVFVVYVLFVACCLQFLVCCSLSIRLGCLLVGVWWSLLVGCFVCFVVFLFVVCWLVIARCCAFVVCCVFVDMRCNCFVVLLFVIACLL